MSDQLSKNEQEFWDDLKRPAGSILVSPGVHVREVDVSYYMPTPAKGAVMVSTETGDMHVYDGVEWKMMSKNSGTF